MDEADKNKNMSDMLSAKRSSDFYGLKLTVVIVGTLLDLG